MHSESLLVSLLSCLLVRDSLAGPVAYEYAAEDDVAAVGSYIHEVRQLAPSKVAAEVEDLMGAGNAPKPRDNKKRMKNISGMCLIISAFSRIGGRRRHGVEEGRSEEQ